MKILISACLIGVNCRYNGGGELAKDWMEVLKDHQLIPVCPEQLGGMSTPREPSEIVCESPLCVESESGTDVTHAFESGASASLELGKLLGASCAILKERSPSCGVNLIYDGTFRGVRIPGMGITARLLKGAGLRLYSEEELERFIMENGGRRTQT